MSSVKDKNNRIDKIGETSDKIYRISDLVYPITILYILFFYFPIRPVGRGL